MAGIALEQLREEDVRALVRHPDPERRASAAQRICRTVRSAQLSAVERAFAYKLLDYIAQDAVAIVRRALAITLKNSPELPRSVAKKLIADIDNIAVPILAHSPVLTDEDLVDVLRSKAAAKIIAVARRPKVSGTVVREIVRFGDSHAVAEIAANDGAIIDAELAESMLELYKNDDLIKDAFIARRDLPARIVEKLITLVSEEAAILINRRHEVPVDVAIDLANRVRERATLDVIDTDIRDRELEQMMKRLADEARLTASFLIRAAGLGRMNLLQYGLARLAGVTPSKTLLMIHDGGPLGLQTLCLRAGLTQSQAKIVRAAVAIYRDLELSGIEYDEIYFQSLMIERMLTLPLNIPESEQNWFLERLDGLGEKLAA